MFRRFLKLFKNDEPGSEERFEGSYLDHLLEQSRPTMVQQLEQCPEHDPVLLAVVGVLRNTMLNAWAPEMRSPLVDRHTPGAAPPPPPGATPSEAFDDTDEHQIPAPAAAEPPQDSSPEEPEAESEEPVEEPADNAIDDDDVLEAEDQTRARITEEIDVTELQSLAAQSEPIEKDNTVEMERGKLALGALPRLDTPDVLNAGRAFLNLLIDNDRLPSDLQLNVSETTLARDLLLGYFIGDDDFDGKARRLLTIVEKKFADGLFSQAQILLRLFHTDESTRITNDRNLFYEDMILRLGIRRRHKLNDEETSQLKERLKAATTDKGQRELFAWLDHKLLVKLHLLGRSTAAVDAWKQSIAASAKPGARDKFLELIPPTRWRPVDRQDLPVLQQIQKHITHEAARHYVISQIRTCYFVLRAVGDTGLEGYLDSFFDWTQREFDLNGTRLMPLLYNRSMSESASMTEILQDVYEAHFADKVKAKFDAFDDAKTEAAYKRSLEQLGKFDFGEVAPGYYDLGGFVFDQLFNMNYPNREFAAKIHRIT